MTGRTLQAAAPARTADAAATRRLERGAGACSRHPIGSVCAACGAAAEVGSVLRRTAIAAPPAGGVPRAVYEALARPGQPLDRHTRRLMEDRFQTDFGGVRIHVDTGATLSAQAVHALAYTVGTNIVFGPGQYAPSTSPGQRLLAHELAHVVQHGPAQASTAELTVAPANDALEQQAHQVADQPSGATRALAPIAVRSSRGHASQLHRQPALGREAGLQGDVPGENPVAVSQHPGGEESIRIDGDGDQHKELRLQLKETSWWPSSDPTMHGPLKSLRLQIVQVSSNASRQIDFELPQPTQVATGFFFPIVEEVTDGKAPTRISLVSTVKQWLEVYPPTAIPSGVEYVVVAGGRRFLFQFPPEKDAPQPIASGMKAGVVSGILSAEVSLGAYSDRFGITMQSLGGDKAILGISLLRDGAPVDTKGAEVHVAGQIRFGFIDTGPVSFGIDLDGDGKADLVVYDRLTGVPSYQGGGPPDKDRDHQIRVTGPAVGPDQVLGFQIRENSAAGGNVAPTGADREAESRALAVYGLAAEARAGTYQTQLQTTENQFVTLRKQAADNGVLGQAVFNAWQTLSIAMIQLEPQTRATVDAGLQQQAAAGAASLYRLLLAETQAAEKRVPTRAGTSVSNPYAREFHFEGLGQVVQRGAGPRLEGEIRRGEWKQAFADYADLVNGLDQWIVDQWKIKRGVSREVEELTAARNELRSIQQFNPTRVLGVFNPDRKFYTEQGYVPEIPLSLYAWREGSTWHLKDLTVASKPYEYPSVDVKPGELDPPARLFAGMDDPDHFPEGIIHFDIPGKYSGYLHTRDRLTWKKFFAYLSLGVAVVGVTLATLGSGTVAVVGVGALAASGVFGALSAGIDLVERYQRGNLDAPTAAVDIAQIVGGLAGATALVSGTILRSAATATAGARLSGVWARTAILANRVYLPAVVTDAATQTVQLVTVLPDTARSLESIEARPDLSRADKDRAKVLLLTQVAALTGLAVLNYRGLAADLTNRPTLVLSKGPEDVPVVSTALGKDSVILETNAAVAFNMRAEGKKLDPGHEAAIKRVEALGASDPRIVDRTLAELTAGGHTPSERGVGLLVARESPEYQAVLGDLKNPNDPVGGRKAKAFKDQEIVADTFFAATEPGVTPRLATADSGIYNPLSRRAGYDPSQKGGGVSVPVKFKDKGGFAVTINGRTIWVIPLR